MRSNERLQRVLAIRQLGGAKSAVMACAASETRPASLDDLKLFLLTFAGGFLFTSVFIG